MRAAVVAKQRKMIDTVYVSNLFSVYNFIPFFSFLINTVKDIDYKYIQVFIINVKDYN